MSGKAISDSEVLGWASKAYALQCATGYFKTSQLNKFRCNANLMTAAKGLGFVQLHPGGRYTWEAKPNALHAKKINASYVRRRKKFQANTDAKRAKMLSGKSSGNMGRLPRLEEDLAALKQQGVDIAKLIKRIDVLEAAVNSVLKELS